MDGDPTCSVSGQNGVIGKHAVPMVRYVPVYGPLRLTRARRGVSFQIVSATCFWYAIRRWKLARAALRVLSP